MARHAVRRRTPALALVVAVALLGACSDGGDDSAISAIPTPVPTQVVTTADCLAPQVIQALGLPADERPRTAAHPDVPAAGPAPEGFAPVSVVLCTTGEMLTDATGTWAAVTTHRLEGDVGPLVKALGTGDQTPAASAKAADCTAAQDGAVVLWLVDALGRAVRVPVPLDGCGLPAADVAKALDGLTEVDVEHDPVALVSAARSTAPAS